MGKAFTKGQRVTVICDWDRKGTVWVRHATVHSCGSKVLRLTCDVTGEEFGWCFAPAVAQHGCVGVRPYLDGAALDAEATAVAVNALERERAHLTFARDRVANGPHPCHRYIAAMNANLAALHEPRWALHSDLSAEVAQRVQEELDSRAVAC